MMTMMRVGAVENAIGAFSKEFVGAFSASTIPAASTRRRSRLPSSDRFNLTRSLAIQLAEHNIRVNCVVPNKIGSPVGKDEFNPNRKVVNLRNRPGEPIDLARAMLFLDF